MEDGDTRSSLGILSHHHLSKEWGLERSGLKIEGPVRVMTYRGKEFIPPSRINKVLRSIHRDHKGAVTGQQKAHQKWFWPYMEDYIIEDMDGCGKCKEGQKPRYIPKEETLVYQPSQPTTLLRGGIDY